MELQEKPSKRTPRSIPPERHEDVWKLHLEGLDPPRIAEKLAASGCHATRHSVRRLVIQLNRAQTRDAHSEKIAEELKLSRASALALRDMHQESLNDVCDDLVIAARKDKYERTLALSRAGRILLRAVAHYDHLYQLALKQESRLPKADPEPPIPDGAPSITSPTEGARIPNAMFYPNGLGVPSSTVDMTIDDIPLPPDECTPNNGQWFAPPFSLKPGDHTFAVRYLDAPPSAPKSVVNFTIIGCLLFLLLSNLACGGRSPFPDLPVKMVLAPAPTRSSRVPPIVEASSDRAAPRAGPTSAVALYRPPRPIRASGQTTEPVVNEIEIIYLRSAVHPDIKLIQLGPGIEKIVKEAKSYWVYGTTDGPLAGKRVEIPADNVAAIQWKISSPATTG